MSFEFHLSSDEEDNSSTISFTTKQQNDEINHAISSESNTFNTNNEINNDTNYEDENDDLAIEWEDGDGEDLSSSSSFLESHEYNTLAEEKEENFHFHDKHDTTKTVLKDVTIELNINNETNEIVKEVSSNKKKRTVSKIKLENLPNTVASLILSLHRCHLLCLISHSMYICNTICSSDLLIYTAYSILPTFILDSHDDITANRVPSEDEIKKVCTWFSQYINGICKRRMNIMNRNINLGAPGRGRRRRPQRQTKTNKKQSNQPSSEAIKMQINTNNINLEDRLLRLLQALSPIYEENPNDEAITILSTIQPEEKSYVLLCILKSLGYNVRFVSSLMPISRDFTISHPLLFSNQENEDVTTPTHPVLWLEVLCYSMPDEKDCSTSSSSKYNKTKTKNRRKLNWLHVDIHHEVMNQPRVVESIQTNILQSSTSNNVTSSAYTTTARNNTIRKKQKVIPVSYVIAIEPSQQLNQHTKLPCTITDVTPRYANAWSQSLAIRGMTKMQILASQGYCIDEWWADTLDAFKTGKKRNTKKQKRKQREDEVIVIDDSDDIEDNTESNKKRKTKRSEEVKQEEHIESQSSTFNEAIPTSKAAFKNHPCYAIPSQLNKDQVLHPNAKQNMCGIFKGEVIYRRSDVSSACSYKKWLYLNRKVKSEELGKPVIVKKPPKRKKNAKFKALDSYGVGEGNDGSEDTRKRILKNTEQELIEDDLKLYGLWQTCQWSPPYIGPNDPLPVNSHNNIDIKLLNPGLVHMQQPKLSLLAKKLGIPYAPCLLGFEGHHGNRTPTIKGIVVHQHNQILLQEAYEEYQGSLIEKECAKRQKDIYARWKRLIVGIVTKDRLEREYGDDDDENKNDDGKDDDDDVDNDYVDQNDSDSGDDDNDYVDQNDSDND